MHCRLARICPPSAALHSQSLTAGNGNNAARGTEIINNILILKKRTRSKFEYDAIKGVLRHKGEVDKKIESVTMPSIIQIGFEKVCLRHRSNWMR